MENILMFFFGLSQFFKKEVTFDFVKIQEHLVDELHSIDTFFKISPRSIYVPHSQNDFSVGKAFPKAKVIFVENDVQHVKALLWAWARYVYKKNPKTYLLPEPVDIWIVLDREFSEVYLKNVKHWGYLICNNYHHFASDLKQKKGFELVGIITDEGIDDSELEDYFQTAQTDADLRRAGVYNLYKKSIEKVNPEVENVMEFMRRDYKKIMGTETYLGFALSLAKWDVDKMLPKKRWHVDSACWFGIISNICVFKKI